MKSFYRYHWALVVVLLAVSLSCLASRADPRAGLISITITSNLTGLEINRVFLSPTDRDKWGPDQLKGSTIAPAGSATIENVACDAADLKVIAEDQNGCFFYQTVACGENFTWTIANNATPDCGN